MTPLNFASDNTGPAHPRVIEAVTAAMSGTDMPYGAEAATERVRGRLRELLGWPDAAIHLVSTGTAGNALALACLCKPWSAVFCHRTAHVQEDECNAPEFYTGGAKLVLVDGPEGRMDPGALSAAIAAEETRGVHGPQRGAVTITQVTEKGTVHSVDQIGALRDACEGLPMHMDGARIANAVAAGTVPLSGMAADLDAITFGGTKNGCMAVEAVAFRDPAPSWEFELRRKRGAHLFSKHRLLSAQMDAYLEGDLWLEMARSANAACARLAAGLREIGAEMLFEPEANLIFCRLPRRAHAKAQRAGALYYVMDGEVGSGDPEEMLSCRLVCDWSCDTARVDRLLEGLA